MADDVFDEVKKEVEDTGFMEVVQKIYPLAAEGMHSDCVCSKAMLVETKYGTALKIHWETEEEYEGDDGKTYKKMLFSKPLGFYYGDGTNLHNLCMSVTGRPPQAFFVEKGGTKHFAYNLFVGMKTGVLCKHTEKDEKTYANIGEYLATKDQKLFNQGLLGDEPPKPAKVEKKAAKTDEKEVKIPKKESNVDNVLTCIKETETEKQLENVRTLLIEGSQFTKTELAVINEAWDKHCESIAK